MMNTISEQPSIHTLLMICQCTSFDLISLTFLAPNNDALTPPQRRKTLTEIKPHDPDALLQLVFQAGELHAFNDDKGDDDDKNRKKKIFRALLKDVLNYHILPYVVTSTNLGENSTGVYASWAMIYNAISLLYVQCERICTPTMNHMMVSTVVSRSRKNSCRLCVILLFGVIPAQTCDCLDCHD